MNKGEIVYLSKQMAAKFSAVLDESLPAHTGDETELYQIIMTSAAMLTAATITAYMDESEFETAADIQRDMVVILINDLK